MDIFVFLVFLFIMVVFSFMYFPMMIFLSIGVRSTDDIVASIVLTIALVVGWVFIFKLSPFSIVVGG